MFLYVVLYIFILNKKKIRSKTKNSGKRMEEQFEQQVQGFERYAKTAIEFYKGLNHVFALLEKLYNEEFEWPINLPISRYTLSRHRTDLNDIGYLLNLHIKEHDLEFTSAYDILLQMAKKTAENSRERQEMEQIKKEREKLNVSMEERKRKEEEKIRTKEQVRKSQEQNKHTAQTFEKWKQNGPPDAQGRPMPRKCELEDKCACKREYVHYLGKIFLTPNDFVPFENIAQIKDDKQWKKLFMKISLQLHPDKSGDDVLFKSLWTGRDCFKW